MNILPFIIKPTLLTLTAKYIQQQQQQKHGNNNNIKIVECKNEGIKNEKKLHFYRSYDL